MAKNKKSNIPSSDARNRGQKYEGGGAVNPLSHMSMNPQIWNDPRRFMDRIKFLNEWSGQVKKRKKADSVYGEGIDPDKVGEV